MKKFIVIFSYAIDVEAKNRPEAIQKASEIWDNVCPRTDEMNVEVEYAD